MDGLLVPAFFIMCFQEPLWSYFGHWFTYNAYLVNYGSWLGSVPGVQSYAEPGHMLVYPILWIAPVYPLVFFSCSWIGAWALRKGKARWPGWGNVKLVCLVCFPVLVVFDVFLEGLLFMPLGFYTYPGSLGPVLFPESYHAFPLHIAVAGGVLFTGMTCLRYFKNDRGETFAERGASRLQISDGRKAIVRFFALAGCVQLIFFLSAGLPHMFVGANSGSWPEDHQSRSYFVDGLCGPDTDRVCPGGKVVPFEDGQAPPLNGGIFGWAD